MILRSFLGVAIALSMMAASRAETRESWRIAPTFGLPTGASGGAAVGSLRLTELPVLPGHCYGLTRGINERGQILGISEGCELPAAYAAVIWEGAEITETVWHVQPWDINEAGHFVGAHYDGTGEVHATLYKNGSLEDLGRAGHESVAYSLNNGEQVIGMIRAPGAQHAEGFAWIGGTMWPIDAWFLGHSVGINERGQAIGFRNSPDRRSFVWERGVSTDLGGLGGAYTSAASINARGEITGTSMTNLGQGHAFLWAQGHMVDLGTFGGANSTGQDINNRGEVVGWAQTENGEWRPFVRHRDGLVDLGIAGSQAAAIFINDSGDVAFSSGDGPSYAWSRGRLFLLEDHGFGSRVTGINNRGQIAGVVSAQREEGGYYDRAAVWSLE